MRERGRPQRGERARVARRVRALLDEHGVVGVAAGPDVPPTREIEPVVRPEPPARDEPPVRPEPATAPLPVLRKPDVAWPDAGP
ncbi:MAG TPA: hypothetical protein VGL21_02620, partial [Jatrophihabitantaceae bacterium]